MRQSLQCVWALTQLRSVNIECDGVNTTPLHLDSFQGLSGMAQLSSLCLMGPYLSVMLAGQWPYWKEGEEPVPGLTALTQLQVLKLQGAGGFTDYGGKVQPSVLAVFANLQHPTLQGVHINVPSFKTGAKGLLRLLPQLQQLTGLELRVACLEAASPTALTALTASSNLKYLSLFNTRLPGGADTWQQVFAANCSRLEEVSLIGSDNLECLKFKLTDLQCIVQRCPNLKAFSFQDATAEAVPLLTGLTMLYTIEFDDDFVRALVQQLGGLRDLHLADTRLCTPDTLLELTRLQQLTRLKLGYKYWREDKSYYLTEPVEFVQQVRPNTRLLNACCFIAFFSKYSPSCFWEHTVRPSTAATYHPRLSCRV